MVYCTGTARARASIKVRHKKVNGEKGAVVVLVEISKVVQYCTPQPAHLERNLRSSTRAWNLFFILNWVRG